jgi:hypothetical protein
MKLFISLSAKGINRKKFYIVSYVKDATTIVEGPYSSKEANQIKAKKYPDANSGMISHGVTSGQECLDEGFKWAE